MANITFIPPRGGRMAATTQVLPRFQSNEDAMYF